MPMSLVAPPYSHRKDGQDADVVQLVLLKLNVTFKRARALPRPVTSPATARAWAEW